MESDGVLLKFTLEINGVLSIIAVYAEDMHNVSACNLQRKLGEFVDKRIGILRTDHGYAVRLLQSSKAAHTHFTLGKGEDENGSD
ncbi:MAG: hypothetical protein NZ926_02675 [Candidatus Methanomethylicia archaeon]|nr:hypothetical protein [Candidatus Methanomethylicia archaeon]MDW7989036.1 hypothetical protein [Nitrososphaerota archaeon]